MPCETEREPAWGRPRIALPVAHLLALAPLDVWLRMLARSGGVRPRYWPRLAFILFTSFVGSVISVHERLAMALYWRTPRGRRALQEHQPEIVVILGYYRSGTTHLHNLLACDPRLVTPRWAQCLAGQGYTLAWTLVRTLLVPFLGRTRPQDRVGFGPSWPGEDDFALATWGACSSLPGRHIFPDRWDDWRRWHDLSSLSPAERRRWEQLTRRFVYKITRGRSDRVVLLKSPSHSARVAHLDRLFQGRVRFVHLVREPEPVIDSNMRMFHALRHHALADLPDVRTLRKRVVDEYEKTEHACAEALDALPGDRWVRVRFKDLRADPMGVLESVYTGIGIPFEPHARERVLAYLGSLGAYDNTREPIDLGEVTEHERRVREEIRSRAALDAPARTHQGIAYTPRPEPRMLRGTIGGAGVAAACWGAWLLLVALLQAIDPGIQMRLVALVWPVGALIGSGARRAAGGRGTRTLGLWSGALTLVVVVTVLFPVSVIIWNWAADDGFDAWWHHNWRNVRQALSGTSSIVLMVLGTLSAYRHASEDGPIVPGH